MNEDYETRLLIRKLNNMVGEVAARLGVEEAPIPPPKTGIDGIKSRIDSLLLLTIRIQDELKALRDDVEQVATLEHEDS